MVVNLFIYDLLQIPSLYETLMDPRNVCMYVSKYVRHAHCVTYIVFPEFEVFFQGAKAVDVGRGFNMI